MLTNRRPLENNDPAFLNWSGPYGSDEDATTASRPAVENVCDASWRWQNVMERCPTNFGEKCGRV